MKKISLIAIVALAALTSCKKDRTCTCTVTYTSLTYNGVPVSGVTFTPTTNATTYKKVKKSQAAANCTSGKVKMSESDGSDTYALEGTADCKLS